MGSLVHVRLTNAVGKRRGQQHSIRRCLRLQRTVYAGDHCEAKWSEDLTDVVCGCESPAVRLGVRHRPPRRRARDSRSKFWGGDDQRVAFKNWGRVTDPRNLLDARQGVNERIMLRELLRRADMMVILENKFDVLVRLHTPRAPSLIGHSHQYDIPSNLRLKSPQRPECGIDRSADPAAMSRPVTNQPLSSPTMERAISWRHPTCQRRWLRPACRSGWCFAASPERKILF
jgi:hypothetical protein